MSELPTEPRDNIEVDKVETTEVEETEKKQLAIELYDMSQAIEMVSKHYERTFKEVSFKFPVVIADGSVVEFMDLQTNSVMAKFILRTLNSVSINETTGQMSLPIMFSSMLAGAAMNSRSINIDLKPKDSKDNKDTKK